MKAIAILSGKGGTGKTSITLSLGHVLAHCGFKTLLIDLDLFTHGMTFYSLGKDEREAPFSLADIFKRGGEKPGAIPVLRIPGAFAGSNLFMIPSLTTGNLSSNELAITREFDDIAAFSSRLRKLIDTVIKKHKFEQVIIDTRGGTDHTSIGAAMASGACIVVTEADKPSWEMGRVLG